jgi:hypothetical protein
VAELTWNAFRDHLIVEYEIPKYEGDLGNPNVLVPLSEDTSRFKVETLFECFPSQHDKPWFTRETFRSLLRLRGLECHSSSGYAEGFHCRKAILAAAPLQTNQVATERTADRCSEPARQPLPLPGCGEEGPCLENPRLPL